MTQKEILQFFTDYGGLRCRDWSLRQIRAHLKAYFGNDQRIYLSTCRALKQAARMYQQ